MNQLDKIIIRERRRKCKRLKKVRKARDMASKYTENTLLLSKVSTYIGYRDEEYLTGDLAKFILDHQVFIISEKKLRR